MSVGAEGGGRTITLIGAPTDAGAADRGGSMGPEALRVAGIATALGELGYSVEDRGNLAGPGNPGKGPVDGYRHLREVAAWCALVRDAVIEALREGTVPVVLGGDHSLAIGTVAGIARFAAERGEPVSVLWLDAHADANTPATTPTGNLHGMPVAVIAGVGPPELIGLGPSSPMVPPSRIVQVGIRSVDRQEKTWVASSGIETHDMRRIDERGMRETMETVLGRLAELGGHVHVSLDVDFLDPAIAPGVGTPVAGGPTYREAQLCMEMICDSGLMRSLDIAELNPARDHHNLTAELMVELAESLFGEQILSRHRASL